MRTLYLDCSMGAAGDMLTSALLELLPNPQEFTEKLNSLGIPHVKYIAEKSVKCGITGTHVTVLVDGEEESEHMHEHHHERNHEHNHNHEHSHEHGHRHSTMADIEHIVRGHTNIPESIRDDILSVYNLIAQAESHAHGKPVTDIHFHEVGTMDAVADVAAVCMLINELNPDEIVASPVCVGCGTVKCAHGILPVPAPATAYILQGVPAYGGNIRSELCTPTGAALLKHFVNRFSEMPLMKISAIGYGMGKKDFEAANCLRAMLGESNGNQNGIVELSFNVDDMTGEAAAYAAEKLFEGGALEVFTLPAGMKKGRPGILFKIICRQQDKQNIITLMFKHTSTIGVRETPVNRYVLDRKIETVNTPYGKIRRKRSTGYGVTRVKIEHEDLARIAAEQGISLSEARKLLGEYEK